MAGLQDVKAALKIAQQAALGPGVAASVSRGQASLIVAQAGAIAIQDATDYLRSCSTICSTASGLAIALAIANKDAESAAVLAAVTTIMGQATAQFGATGAAAAAVVTGFPTQ